jgi:hypothetical protein
MESGSRTKSESRKQKAKRGISWIVRDDGRDGFFAEDVDQADDCVVCLDRRLGLVAFGGELGDLSVEPFDLSVRIADEQKLVSHQACQLSQRLAIVLDRLLAIAYRLSAIGYRLPGHAGIRGYGSAESVPPLDAAQTWPGIVRWLVSDHAEPDGEAGKAGQGKDAGATH